MCLSIATRRPQDVLGKGEHVGFEWQVIHNGRGFRCGYVRVPTGHPWHGVSYGDIDAEVHGGLTFSETDELCDKGQPDDGYWIGFDCAHYMDRIDPDLPCGRLIPSFGCEGEIRTQEYVEHECRMLCEQANSAGKV